MNTQNDGVLASMQDRFAKSGLAAPPVPAFFATSLREFAEPLMWTTRPEAHDLYGFRAAVHEAESGDVGDYLAFGHAGHGVNSFAVSYYLVLGPLKLLLQVPWGGIYMDAAQATADVARAFQRAGELIAAIDTLDSQGSSVSVFASGFYGTRSVITGPVSQGILRAVGDLLGLRG